MNNKNSDLTFNIPMAKTGITVRTFLRKECNFSSRLLTKLKKEENGIQCNGIKIRTIDTLHTGDILNINFPQDISKITPIKVNLKIIYEDEHLLVVDKPLNMPVHPTKDHITDTLANGVMYYYKEKKENHKFMALNRLDKDTTGLVLIAKNKFVANMVKTNIIKEYFAVCEGEISAKGLIDFPIRIAEGHTIQRETGIGGVSAITYYKPLLYKNKHTLLSIKLGTGRTHQIRVHMASINHSLAGDDMYGGSLSYIKRQALHCGSIDLIHPVTKEKLHLHSDIPSDIANILK